MSATMKRTRKLAMQKRETPAQRAVSFSKRRHGLFKKAAELCMLSGSRIGLIVSSPASKQNWYSFGHPSVEAVFDAFLHGRVPQDAGSETVNSAICVYNAVKGLEGELERRSGKNGGGLRRDFEFDDLFEAVLGRCQTVAELQVVVGEMEKLRENAVKRLNHLLASKESEFGSEVGSIFSENNINGIEDDGDLGFGNEVEEKSIVVSGDDHYNHGCYCSSYQDANSLTMVPDESYSISQPHESSGSSTSASAYFPTPCFANPVDEAMFITTENEWDQRLLPYADPVDKATSFTPVNGWDQLLSHDDPLFFLG